MPKTLKKNKQTKIKFMTNKEDKIKAKEAFQPVTQEEEEKHAEKIKATNSAQKVARSLRLKMNWTNT